jgi:hypothetical protein
LKLIPFHYPNKADYSDEYGPIKLGLGWSYFNGNGPALAKRNSYRTRTGFLRILQEDKYINLYFILGRRLFLLEIRLKERILEHTEDENAESST